MCIPTLVLFPARCPALHLNVFRIRRLTYPHFVRLLVNSRVLVFRGIRVRTAQLVSALALGRLPGGKVPTRRELRPPGDRARARRLPSNQRAPHVDSDFLQGVKRVRSLDNPTASSLDCSSVIYTTKNSPDAHIHRLASKIAQIVQPRELL